MTIDLEALSRKELVSLRKNVEKAISSLADRERKRALKALEVAAAEHGFSLSELTGKAAVRKSFGKSPARFRNPDDAGQTWTGKGRRPRWIVAAQEAGTDLAKFEI